MYSEYSMSSETRITVTGLKLTHKEEEEAVKQLNLNPKSPTYIVDRKIALAKKLNNKEIANGLTAEDRAQIDGRLLLYIARVCYYPNLAEIVIA